MLISPSKTRWELLGAKPGLPASNRQSPTGRAQ